MSALPLRRAGRGACPAGPAGVTGAAWQRRSCDPRAARPRRSSRLSRPAQSRPGASPRSLTVVWPARLPARVRIPSNSRTSHANPQNPLGRGRPHGRRLSPMAHARLSSRCLRRPYLPSHARHRRSRRSRRAHAAGRQLCSLQLRRRPRVGREFQLDQDDHPGPERSHWLRADMGAPGRLRLERARHRAAVAGAVHPRRRVHVQGRLRHIVGRNRHGNAGGLRRAKHLLSAGGRRSRLRNFAANP